MPYIPPHLRPGWVSPPPPAPKAPKPRGVHYKSNNTGLPSTNQHWHRYEKNGVPDTLANASKAHNVSTALSKRKVRAVKVPTYKRKSALKGKSKHRKTRAAKSNEKEKKHVRKTHKAHSR